MRNTIFNFFNCYLADKKKLSLNLILQCQKSIKVAQTGKNEKHHYSKKYFNKIFIILAHILGTSKHHFSERLFNNFGLLNVFQSKSIILVCLNIGQICFEKVSQLNNCLFLNKKNLKKQDNC
jgi:hypothetical protein